MRIRVLQQGKELGTLEIHGQLTEQEYLELRGRLQDLRLFAAESVSEPASCVKTGARHSFAKYLLFPVGLRRKWRADDYDFGKLRCGALPHGETLFVIYSVPLKGAPRK